MSAGLTRRIGDLCGDDKNVYGEIIRMYGQSDAKILSQHESKANTATGGPEA